MIPHTPGGAPDLGHSPRRALVLTLELALVLVLGVPLAVVVQPVIPGGGLIVLALVVVLAIATRRSITDFDEHVRAGSSLIVEVLGRQTADAGPPALAEAHALLPGFEGLTPIAVPAGSSAVGKSLAELDLRAVTGASVLAISRTEGGTANPSPTEPLRAGDVLALAGSADAIAAARALVES
jgi:CPA2 family monovalent cation:H+ antiporter-2